ncbi:MAG TPA: NAD(P)-dependent oxidoreductase [Kiloniellaceae bacterium]|nr:NAD(P)-dependent oxidoreductase [Kiloniellaceae bacterium]
MRSAEPKGRKNVSHDGRSDGANLRRIAFLGFGEAGPVLAKALRNGCGAEIAAFDALGKDPAGAELIARRAADSGAILHASAAEAVVQADLIISVVTASAALSVARSATPALRAGQVYLDLNSVSPVTKRHVSDVVTPTGADFVEGVAMDRVPSRGGRAPILICGTRSDSCAALLNAAGLNVTAVGSALGAASGAKLCRSIITKGLEALVTEAARASDALGVRESVFSSLSASFPQLDWPALADDFAVRMRKHGRRRSAEMLEAAAMLTDLGLPEELCGAIARSQKRETQR